MKRVCLNPDCTLPEGGVCARAGEFSDPLTQCPNLVREEAETAGSEAPWSGRHMSENDAEHLMYERPARVLGIVGPTSAGKTCLIVSLFLQLADGQCQEFAYRFASSRSLFALHEKCNELGKWDGQTSGTAMSHTSRDLIGFIHLGLRPCSSENRHIDLLLCDISGEHFSSYTSHADEANQQRVAFLRRCDGFVLVVDAIDLHGPKGRRLETELARMAGRLVDTIVESGRHEVPIAVMLSKADAVPNLPCESTALLALLATRAPRLSTTLKRAQLAQIPLEVFAVAAIPHSGQPFGVQECFGYLLAHADRQARWPCWVPPVPESPTSSFLAMRVWRDEP